MVELPVDAIDPFICFYPFGILALTWNSIETGEIQVNFQEAGKCEQGNEIICLGQREIFEHSHPLRQM